MCWRAYPSRRTSHTGSLDAFADGWTCAAHIGGEEHGVLPHGYSSSVSPQFAPYMRWRLPSTSLREPPSLETARGQRIYCERAVSELNTFPGKVSVL